MREPALRLTRFADLLAELARLEHAPPALASSWTLAQALEHCAQSIELSLTGYPELRAWPVRKLIGPLVKKRFLARGFMSHDRAAPIPGAPAIASDAQLPAAFARLRKAVETFRAFTGTPAPHLAYGPCTKAEYEALHSMHFADHLSAPAGDV